MVKDATSETTTETKKAAPKKAAKRGTRKVETKKGTKKKAAKSIGTVPSTNSNYPRHSIVKALRIPKAILEQNAGKECTDVRANALKLFSSSKYG